MDLDQYDYSQFTIIGAGTCAVAITDGTIVIKVGLISSDDVCSLKELAQLNLAPTVHDYCCNAIIPESLVMLLKSCEQYINYVDHREAFVADVIIVDYIQPALSHATHESQRYIKASRIADRLAFQLWRKHSIRWSDHHGYNIGIRGFHAVVLDC